MRCEVDQPIPVGDGAALLARRPDVRAAERRLAASTARIGVATADLYPRITLGGSVGSTGTEEPRRPFRRRAAALAAGPAAELERQPGARPRAHRRGRSRHPGAPRRIRRRRAGSAGGNRSRARRATPARSNGARRRNRPATRRGAAADITDAQRREGAVDCSARSTSSALYAETEAALARAGRSRSRAGRSTCSARWPADGALKALPAHN